MQSVADAVAPGSVAALHDRVCRLLLTHRLPAAAFYGDKLVSLTPNAPENVFLLVEVYVRSSQWSRAQSVLKRNEASILSQESWCSTFHYFSGRIHCALGNWSDAQAAMDACIDANVSLNFLPVPEADSDTQVALSILRANIYRGVEDKSNATKWFEHALKLDPYCVEAFHGLTEDHLVPSSRLSEIVADHLDSGEHMHWVKHIYDLVSARYDVSVSSAELQRTASLLPEHMCECSDIMTALAEALFYRYKFTEAYRVCLRVIDGDPLYWNCLEVYICTLVELDKKADLYKLCHTLVSSRPDNALSWFGIACYYFSCSQYEQARQYFRRATSIDGTLINAWLGYGNAFSAEDESENALTAYRTAYRLFPGSHVPALHMGMEYLRAFNIAQAVPFLRKAQSLSPCDPLVANEMGILHFQQRDFEHASQAFRSVVEAGETRAEIPAVVRAALINLGHCLRKMKKFKEAVNCFSKALVFGRPSPSLYAALGFTHHLLDDYATAIECYHKALGLKPGDTFVTDMLTRALEVESHTTEIFYEH